MNGWLNAGRRSPSPPGIRTLPHQMQLHVNLSDIFRSVHMVNTVHTVRTVHTLHRLRTYHIFDIILVRLVVRCAQKQQQQQLLLLLILLLLLLR